MTALPGTPFRYTEVQWKSIEDAAGVCCCKYRAMMEAFPEEWLPKGQKRISRSARFAEERTKLSVLEKALKIVRAEFPPDPSETEHADEEDYQWAVSNYSHRTQLCQSLAGEIHMRSYALEILELYRPNLRTERTQFWIYATFGFTTWSGRFGCKKNSKTQSR